MADKPIGKDATGYEILTDAIKALLNQYPGLYENETIKFEELGKESGIAFSADNGALIYSEKIVSAKIKPRKINTLDSRLRGNDDFFNVSLN